uniref:Uncharacterized protein n=1 Tax=Tanacetum cinerariifolium TaxID=118510 RepID=A0A699GIR0_TANCI|nr:hypothetical protein [Tanacetum cinerariifolium]
MLAEALESRGVLDEGHMEFLADTKDTFTTSSAVLMVKLSAYDSDILLEHIICQDVMSIVMHADVESTNVLPANNNSLEYDNLEVELLIKENDRLLELIISQDLVHTVVNNLATIANHQNMEKCYLDEYNENLELQAKLSKRNDVVERAVYNELSKKCARMESRLVPNPSSTTSYVPPTKNTWDILFQPMFGEYFNPLQSVVSLVPVAAAPRHVDPTGTPLSTSIDQDTPSTSTSPTQKTQSLVIHSGVEEQLNENKPAQFDNDPFLDILTSEPSS